MGKLNLKFYAAGLMTMALLLLPTLAFAETQQMINVMFGRVKLIVNGKPVEKETFLYNGTNYVPLHAVAEALNNEIRYDSSTNTTYIDENDQNETSQVSDASKQQSAQASFDNSIKAADASHGENEVWYDYDIEQWVIGNPTPKDYGIKWWADTDLDGDGKITSADQYIFDLPRVNMIETLKGRPEYDSVLAWYQGVGETTDLSGLWLNRPPETIAIEEYHSAICSVEVIRLSLMQIDKLLLDSTIVIAENELRKINQRRDELLNCRRIFENSTIANYERLHGTDVQFNIFDQSYYDTMKNNTAKWVMLYGTPGQKAAEPAYKPPVLPDAPESVEPTNPVQDAMRRQLQSANE